MENKTRGQTIIEYFVIMAIVLAVILSSGFIGRIRSGFQAYFNSAAANMR